MAISSVTGAVAVGCRRCRSSRWADRHRRPPAHARQGWRPSAAGHPRRGSPRRTMIGCSSSRSRTRPSDRRFRPRSDPDEVLHELAGRIGQDGVGRVVLGQDAAALQDGDAVGHLDRLVDVVGDEDDRLAHLRLQPQELVLQPLAADRIDGAEWLVHQHHRRIGRQRARHPDPLALAAGQGGGIATGVGGRVQPDQLQQLVDARRDARRRPAQQARHDGHVVGHRHVREEADLLDDVADPPSQLDRRQRRRRPRRRS